MFLRFQRGFHPCETSDSNGRARADQAVCCLWCQLPFRRVELAISIPSRDRLRLPETAPTSLRVDRSFGISPSLTRMAIPISLSRKSVGCFPLRCHDWLRRLRVLRRWRFPRLRCLHLLRSSIALAEWVPAFASPDACHSSGSHRARSGAQDPRHPPSVIVMSIELSDQPARILPIEQRCWKR